MGNWGLVRHLIDGLAILIMIGWGTIGPVYVWLTFRSPKL